MVEQSILVMKNVFLRTFFVWSNGKLETTNFSFFDFVKSWVLVSLVKVLYFLFLSFCNHAACILCVHDGCNHFT